MALVDDETLKDEGKPLGFKIPQPLVDNIEDFYSLYPDFSLAHEQLDDLKRNELLTKYLNRLQYIIRRMLPILRPEDYSRAKFIGEQTLNFLVRYNDNIEDGFVALRQYHDDVNAMLYDYELTKIKLIGFDAFG
jgi:hypothetical protein